MSKKCSTCGSVFVDDVNFCENCGTRLGAPMSVVADAEPEIVEAEIVDVVIERPRPYDSPAADAREVRERLVGTKQEYYLPQFEKMETLNSFTSWNWAAFIFGTSWMLYRKMYVFGIAMCIVNNLVAAMEVGILNLAIWIGSGLLGNFLYMKDINNRVDKAMDMQPDEREIYIQKNSGTGWTAILIMFVVTMILQMMFA